jgi:hypothetical protein
MKRTIAFACIIVVLFIGFAGSIILVQAINIENQTEIILLNNNPPNIPNKPQGPTGQGFFKILVGKEQTYTTSSIDIDNHDIAYKWDWGDGIISDWSYTKPSGAISFPEEYAWTEAGTYQIRVKARDDPNGDGDSSDGIESNWSDPLPIYVVKINNRLLSNTFFLKLFESFPNLLFALLHFFNSVLG